MSSFLSRVLGSAFPPCKEVYKIIVYKLECGTDFVNVDMKLLEIERNGINKGHAGDLLNTEKISSVRFPTVGVMHFSRSSTYILFSLLDFPSAV
jgi:hypothetical protein